MRLARSLLPDCSGPAITQRSKGCEMNDNKQEILEFYAVGWVSSAHGIKGELYLRLNSKKADWLDKLDRLYLFERDTENLVKDFEILRVKPHKQGLIVKVAEVTDRTAAESLKGLSFKIPRSFLVSEPGENIYLAELEGFELCANGPKSVGTVKGFSSNSMQDLLVIQNSKGEFEVPLIDEFLERIDFKKKCIFMKLPEGLIEWEES